MRKIISLYRLFNILSVDIAVGAVVCALFFSKLLNVYILPYGLIALGLTVWIIYTADHLNDARSIKGTASSERHRFHQRNFRMLFAIIIVAILVDAIVILFMRRVVLVSGVVLAIIVAAYLAIQRHLKLFKEVFVACLYTCGILLPSATVTTTSFHKYSLPALQFFIIAFINLLMLSWFDKDTDKADKLNSFVTVLGSNVTSSVIYILGIINSVLAIFIFQSDFDYEPELVLTSMNIVLLVIFYFRNYVRHNETYRLLGDAVFMIPLVYIWAHS